MAVLVRNGLVVDSEQVRPGDLLLEGERIAALGEEAGRRAAELGQVDVLDAQGLYVLPGGVDGHTHLDMPLEDFASTDDFATGTRAALFGGTTTIVDYAEQGPEGFAQGLAAWKAKAEHKAFCDYGFHMTVKRVDEQTIEEMGEMVASGVCSFKVFMAYPGRMMLTDEEIRRVMRRAAELDALVVVHAEDGLLIEDLIRRARRCKSTDAIDHALTRPSVAEARAVRRAIQLAEETGCRLLIPHMSAAQSVQLVAEARERRVAVTGETCPQYLWLEQRKLRRPGLEGLVYVCSPPLRDVTHMEALWKGLGEGTIQVLGTDHCPFDAVGHKDRGLLPDGSVDFTRTPGGLPGIETRILLAYAGVVAGRFDLPHLVRITATWPAQVFGLAPRKGALRPGADGDVVLLDPEGVTSLDAADLHMRVDHSPYEGMRLPGRLRFVFSRGELVVEDGQFHGKPGRGRFLARRLGEPQSN